MTAPLLEQTLPDGSPAFFTTGAAYGRARGVSRSAVSKWNNAGDLVWVADLETGKKVIDAAASDAKRLGTQNPLKSQAPVVAAGDQAELPVDEPVSEPDIRVAADPLADIRVRAQAAKAKDQEYTALLKRQDYLRRAGDLVSKSEMEQQLKKFHGELMQALLLVPVQAAPKLCPDDPRNARVALDAIMRECLARFAEQGLAELWDVAQAEALDGDHA